MPAHVCCPVLGRSPLYNYLYDRTSLGTLHCAWEKYEVEIKTAK